MENITKIITAVVLGTLILGTIFGSSLAGCKKEGETVSLTDNVSVPNGGLPAIDTSAPAITETATFALG